jgi:hypothetical protein
VSGPDTRVVDECERYAYAAPAEAGDRNRRLKITAFGHNRAETRCFYCAIAWRADQITILGVQFAVKKIVADIGTTGLSMGRRHEPVEQRRQVCGACSGRRIAVRAKTRLIGCPLGIGL